MQIAILLFDGVTALDAIGPYEVLQRVPGATVDFVAGVPGPIATDRGTQLLIAGHARDEVRSPDVVVIPGGYRTRLLESDEPMLEWIRTVHATSQWTTSVCTGALLLGAAGLLAGIDATTHWLERERLAVHGAIPVEDRIVERGKIITAAGVSAGIDMALLLAARIAGEDVARAIQLGIEYDPQPPFDAGSPAKASAATVEFLRAAAARRMT